MRNPGSPTRRTFDLRLVALTLFVAFVSTFLFFNRASTSASALTDPSSADPSAAATEPAAEPQRRRQPQRRRPTPQRRPPARDRSTFSHATPGHFEDCASCHKIPTLGLRQTPTDYLTRSDVEDYPDHDACLNCHRQRYQPLFFKGARPVICAICHKGAITPRNELRFAFPKENVKSQFADVFPHDAHFVSRSLPRFKRLLGDKAKPQDSCAFCHKPNTAEFKQAVAGTSAAVAGAPAAAAETFISKPGAFMTTPQSHASCFDCHWKQGIEGSDFTPLANQCAECHSNLVRPAPKATPTPAPAAPRPAAASSHHAPASSWLTPTMLVAMFDDDTNPLRDRHAAEKFPHEIDAHKCREKVAEKDRVETEGKCKDLVTITCLSCHTTVRKTKTLEELRTDKKNWVQLPTCASTACHTALAGSGPLKLSVFRELQQRKREPKFDCAYCHLPPLSTGPEVPRSHYVVVYEQALKALSEAKAANDEPKIKSAQGAVDRVKAVIPDQFKDIIKE